MNLTRDQASDWRESFNRINEFSRLLFVSRVFFFLSKLPSSCALQFKGNYVRGQTTTIQLLYFQSTLRSLGTHMFVSLAR